MKKIRLLMDVPPVNWDAKMGPAIGSCNDVYFLKDEPWLEIKRTSIAECMKDDVIPWVRQGGRLELLEAERLGWQIMLGPNTVFGCSDHPEYNKKELESPTIYRLLMSDEVNADLARSLCTYDKDKIRQVPYFMRPELYDKPFYYEHEWDLYFHIKTDINKNLRDFYPNFTSTLHGWYCFKELQYKAQHSRACIHGCHYDNYGLAIHEISLLGCPIVYDKFGMKRGSIGEGMGIEVTNVRDDSGEILAEAVKKASEMDRHKVWEASHEYQSIDNCLKRYRKAVCEY